MSAAAVQRVVDTVLAVYRSWTRETGIEAMRRDWEALFAPPASLPAPAPIVANGVPCALFAPPGADRSRVVLFFHGGGFQMGSTRTHGRLMHEIAQAAGVPVMGVDYRLAPEHRFPAPLEDALAAYDWVRDQGFAPGRIALAGDSAGGGLAVSLMLALKARGEPLPAAAALLSPWTDMAAGGGTYESRAQADPIHQREMILALARTYLGRGGDPADPLASPVMGDLSGLPPMLIHVGDREVVLDDARALAERAGAAGVDVAIKVWIGMIHVFQMYPDELPEAAASIAEIGGFLAHYLDVSAKGDGA